METSLRLTMHDYFESTYRPDCDYVDGRLVERNVGLRSHSICVGNISYAFYTNRTAWQVVPLISQRIRVSAERVRVADLCVVSRSNKQDDVVSQAPLVCVEVLAPEDSLGELSERVNDYAAMGVQNIWSVDPWKRLAYYCSTRGFQQPDDGLFWVKGTDIQISLSDVFAELDPAE